MLPLDLQTPGEIAHLLSGRIRTLRLARGWTQQELAERSGITLPSYRRFERTGKIALERLLRIAIALDARAGFDQLFAVPAAQSLAELRRLTTQPTPRRGRRHLADG
jgi:transcriptional regulator with XRE-family HTH domain